MLLPSALFCLQLLLSQNVRQTVKTIIQTHTQTHRGCMGEWKWKYKRKDRWCMMAAQRGNTISLALPASCILHLAYTFRFPFSVCCLLCTVGPLGHWAHLPPWQADWVKPTHRHTDGPTSVLGSVHLSWNFWEEKAVSVCVYSSIRLMDLLRTALW